VTRCLTELGRFNGALPVDPERFLHCYLIKRNLH